MQELLWFAATLLIGSAFARQSHGNNAAHTRGLEKVLVRLHPPPVKLGKREGKGKDIRWRSILRIGRGASFSWLDLPSDSRRYRWAPSMRSVC